VDGLNADERWIIGCALEGFANGESEAAATTYKDSPDEAAELTRQADVARSLMARFAASPSTPADPRPTDPTGSEA
jgi:hypothetical protein